MIGVFDSGDGGLCTVETIRTLRPNADICFLADRENAPYGTKTRGEIIALTKKNIRRLSEAGANKVLIACCTASSIYPELSAEEKRIAIPIIEPTAKEALRRSRTGKIGVIATRATVLSGAFTKSVRSLRPTAEVYEESAQELVSLVESGARDGALNGRTKEKIEKILSKIKRHRFDVIILGCTHFSRLKNTISDIFCCDAVSSAEIGAEEVIRSSDTEGSGINVFL